MAAASEINRIAATHRIGGQHDDDRNLARRDVRRGMHRIKLKGKAKKKYHDDIGKFIVDLTKEHPYLTWGTTGNGEQMYIGLEPVYPWEINDVKQNLTSEQIEREIRAALAPHVKNLVSLIMEYIDEEGWG